MKKQITSPLELNKTSIQLLDDKSLVDVKGGSNPAEAKRATCFWLSCFPSNATE